MGKRVVIIGGVVAGPKVAAKLRRLDPEATITIVEKGKFLSYSGCGLIYYIGGKIKNYQELMETPEGEMQDPEFFEKFTQVKVYNQTEATRINREKKEIETRSLVTGETRILPYDYLVLATGARIFQPNIKAFELQQPDLELGYMDLAHVYTMHGVEDAEAIRWTIKEKLAKKAVIVGGGSIGLEMAECLVENGLEVTLVEMLPEILPTFLDEDIGLLIRRYCQTRGINIQVGETIKYIEGEGGLVKRVITDQGSYEADIVIMATGFKSNSELAQKAGLIIGKSGGIQVDTSLRTSDPNIFAAGDCIEVENLVFGEKVYMPMGSLASKQGRVVALNICGENEIFRGALSSMILKFFEYTIARSGLTVKQAKDLGYEVEYSLVPSFDKARYYPGAQQVIIKMIAEKGTKRLLGAQIIGKGDVSMSIYALAPVLHYGGRLEDLSNLDLPYSPPFSSVIDSVCVAANVLRNKLEGKLVGISPQEVERKRKQGDNFVFLDVRTPKEYLDLRIPGSTLSPLTVLSQKLDDIPKDKEIIIFSEVGHRGYEASLILKNAGFQDVKVMDGGITCWPYEQGRGEG